MKNKLQSRLWQEAEGGMDELESNQRCLNFAVFVTGRLVKLLSNQPTNIQERYESDDGNLN